MSEATVKPEGYRPPANQKQIYEAAKRKRQGALSYAVLDSAPCERCRKDCRGADQLDGWLLYGTCDQCRK